MVVAKCITICSSSLHGGVKVMVIIDHNSEFFFKCLKTMFFNGKKLAQNCTFIIIVHATSR